MEDSRDFHANPVLVPTLNNQILASPYFAGWTETVRNESDNGRYESRSERTPQSERYQGSRSGYGEEEVDLNYAVPSRRPSPIPDASLSHLSPSGHIARHPAFFQPFAQEHAQQFQPHHQFQHQPQADRVVAASRNFFLHQEHPDDLPRLQLH